jgi:hypothetical protein
LVLTSEFARHPFRRNLPKHVTDVIAEIPPLAPARPDQKKGLKTDVVFFLTSFVACFIIIFGLII